MAFEGLLEIGLDAFGHDAHELVDFVLGFRAAHDDEVPGLHVRAGRGVKPAFQDALEVLVADGLVGVGADAAAGEDGFLGFHGIPFDEGCRSLLGL